MALRGHPLLSCVSVRDGAFRFEEGSEVSEEEVFARTSARGFRCRGEKNQRLARLTRRAPRRCVGGEKTRDRRSTRRTTVVRGVRGRTNRAWLCIMMRVIARETYLDLHLSRRALRLGVLRRLRPRQYRQVLFHARHGASRAPRRWWATPLHESRTSLDAPARKAGARLAPLRRDSACRAGPE